MEKESDRAGNIGLLDLKSSSSYIQTYAEGKTIVGSAGDNGAECVSLASPLPPSRAARALRDPLGSLATPAPRARKPKPAKQVAVQALEAVNCEPTSNSFAGVRGLVSKKKRRFQEQGFDLDLSYVTPQIVAMGFPSTGLESAYRNPLGEVQRFLLQRHNHRFRVYNLCSERAYAASEFAGAVVSQYAFRDHHPCRFELLLACCEDITAFVTARRDHVAAIHCKAGKGRTGLVISALLMYRGHASSADSAMSLYGRKRTLNGKGVTIPSQKRYVRYFESYLRLWDRALPPVPFPFAQRLALVCISVLGASRRVLVAGAGCGPCGRTDDRPYIRVRDACFAVIFDQSVEQAHSHPSASHLSPPLPPHELKAGDGDNRPPALGPAAAVLTREVLWAGQLEVVGDFCIEVMLAGKPLCHAWLHAAFHCDPLTPPLCVFKRDLDKAAKDKQHRKFPADFGLEFMFAPCKADPAADPEIARAQSSIVKPQPKAVTKRLDPSPPARSALGSFVGARVSKTLPARRLRARGYDLDLSYVTPRLIAMAFPSEGATGLARNPMDQVQAYFSAFHCGKCLIVNLCAEQAYPSDVFAGPARGNARCLSLPLPAKGVGRLQDLVQAVLRCEAFLAADPRNVVAAHCLAGRGRAGLLLACLLLQRHQAARADHALKHYGHARTGRPLGLACASQRRYVRYFESFFRVYFLPQRPFPFNSVWLSLTRLRLFGAPRTDQAGGCDVFVRVWLLQASPHLLYDGFADPGANHSHWDPTREHVRVLELPELQVAGDFKLELWDHELVGADTLLGACTLHASMLAGTGFAHVTLTRADLDCCDPRVGADFAAQLSFAFDEEEAQAAGCVLAPAKTAAQCAEIDFLLEELSEAAQMHKERALNAERGMHVHRNDMIWFLLHPNARLWVALWSLALNGLIFAEDPVAHSALEAEVQVVAPGLNLLLADWRGLREHYFGLFVVRPGPEQGKRCLNIACACVPR
jgi:protein-tyrosine phosphatase